MLARRPDRFSYEALDSDARLTRADDQAATAQWQEIDWQTALDYVATGCAGLKAARRRRIGALATPHSTLEELYLLQQLVRGLGSENVDFRLRQSDFSADGKGGAPWLGMPVAELGDARPGAGGRLVPAQGPSAVRAPAAPGGQARHARSTSCTRSTTTG